MARCIAALALLLLLGACAGDSGEIDTGGYTQVGLASWYGKRFQGRRTASGEPFDMNRRTAAHPSLPFGTRIEVTNLANGRKLVVRINDRGPSVDGRILDLSRRAAQDLGFLRDGVTRVRLRVLGSEG